MSRRTCTFSRHSLEKVPRDCPSLLRGFSQVPSLEAKRRKEQNCRSSLCECVLQLCCPVSPTTALQLSCGHTVLFTWLLSLGTHRDFLKSDLNTRPNLASSKTSLTNCLPHHKTPRWGGGRWVRSRYSLCLFRGSCYLLNYWLKDHSSASHYCVTYFLQSSRSPERRVVSPCCR